MDGTARCSEWLDALGCGCGHCLRGGGRWMGRVFAGAAARKSDHYARSGCGSGWLWGGGRYPHAADAEWAGALASACARAFCGDEEEGCGCGYVCGALENFCGSGEACIVLSHLRRFAKNVNRRRWAPIALGPL